MAVFAILSASNDAGENVILALVRAESVAEALALYTPKPEGLKAVEVADDFKHPGPGHKLDAATKTVTPAGDAALDAAYTERPTPERQALLDAYAAVEADPTAPASVRAVAALERARHTPKTRGLL